MPQRFNLSSPVDIRSMFCASPYGPRPSAESGFTDFYPGLRFSAMSRPDGQSLERYGALGLPVYSVYEGTVVYCGYESEHAMDGYGNVVVIEHPTLPDQPAVGGHWYTVYAHLADMCVSAEGNSGRVLGGQQIGRVGSTSNGRFSISPALHFEVRQQAPNGVGAPIPATNDPAYLDWAPVETIATSPRARAHPLTFMQRPSTGTNAALGG